MPNKPKTLGRPDIGRALAPSKAELEVQNKARKKYDAKRGNAASRGYNHKWNKTRQRYIDNHPLCENCKLVGGIREADEVHHIVPISEGGATHDDSNLIALCHFCHMHEHKRMNGQSIRRNR